MLNFKTSIFAVLAVLAFKQVESQTAPDSFNNLCFACVGNRFFYCKSDNICRGNSGSCVGGLETSSSSGPGCNVDAHCENLG